jgi:predicted GNAT family acetyltransferase
MHRMPDDLHLADNPSAHRFELRLAGEVAAFSEYNLLSHAILFTHTEVLPAYEGKGLGSKIAKFALDETRRRGLQAIPACPFIAAYLRKHHEYLDLVSEESRRAFKV